MGVVGGAGAGETGAAGVVAAGGVAIGDDAGAITVAAGTTGR